MLNRREYLRNLTLTGIAYATGGPRSLLAQSDSSPQDIAGTFSMKAHAAAKGLLFGCAINPEYFKDERCRKLITEQFNLIVPDNALKFGALCPAPGVYDFSNAETS